MSSSSSSTPAATLSVPRAVALYVGALIGPGLLLIPSLAEHAAGPASIIAWAGLLVLSAPLAITFSALGVRHPVAGGVATYVQEGFGEYAAAATGACFLTAIVFGGPAVALIGGYYVAALTGSGTAVAVGVAFGMYTVVLSTNAAGLRLSSGFQLGLSAVLVLVVAAAVAAAAPARIGEHWAPFAPHGWWAVGTATNILLWLFIGWEAMAQLAGDLPHPQRDLPRAVGLAFGVITVLYVGLAIATVVVPGGANTRAPLADLMGVGFGRAGRDATAILAVALTMGTMNVYIGAAAKLAGALSAEHALPAWLGRETHRTIPRRPLAVLAITSTCLLFALVGGIASTGMLVRAASACFITVYVLALGAATRILRGRLRVCAVTGLAFVVVVAIFSSIYVLVPVIACLTSFALRLREGDRS